MVKVYQQKGQNQLTKQTVRSKKYFYLPKKIAVLLWTFLQKGRPYFVSGFSLLSEIV